jgi:hypothetical protein
MTDRVEATLARVRTDALQDVRPPGVDEVRRTVRRRGVTAALCAAAGVTVITAAIAVAGQQPPISTAPAGPSPNASSTRAPGLAPTPNPTLVARMTAADHALGDPEKLPWVMATSGVVTPAYENHVNDVPADDYQLFVYCVGDGTADVVVKAGNHGNDKLAAGRVQCAAEPSPATLSVRQPVDGYLRVFLSGDDRASAGSAFAFKFVRTAELTGRAGPETTANASAAAQLLAGAGIADPKEVTTERTKTVDEPRPAGAYLLSFGCVGPGKVSFIVRTAKTLRDGTVATNGRTETAVTHECTSAGKLTKDVAISLPDGSAFTITAEVDEPARDRAGWAYAIRPA